ncbi:MAG: hydrogenase formation protein HypD, partial [Deltaproteobacteria bacterium]|nr:hydrogenase formation protein HypD [Deltaproteobacteria bacterium]
HVTTIIGARAYQPLAEAHQVPCVVSGFELTDILTAILMLLKEVEAGSHQVLIQYTRGVAWEGNCQALALVDRIFEPADSLWRGLGQIPESGLKIRPDYARFDAALCFDLDPSQELVVKDPPGCRCGQVLQGLVEPPKCPLFGRTCSPANPVGPCMVSSEGTCAAHYKYR